MGGGGGGGGGEGISIFIEEDKASHDTGCNLGQAGPVHNLLNLYDILTKIAVPNVLNVRKVQVLTNSRKRYKYNESSSFCEYFTNLLYYSILNLVKKFSLVIH